MSKPVLFDELATENGHSIGLLTLNSEKTLNALTLEMVELMLAQLQKWQLNEKIVAVFIQGAGEKALCAGGDVQALRQSSIDNPGGPCVYAETFLETEYRLDYLLHNYAKPTLVWGHGIVMGGGLGIFAACAYRIATERTRIAMPEVTIGLFPDVGGSYFLNRMPGQCGRFLALTGASINGADSLYSGIANYTLGHANKQTILDSLLSLDWSSADVEAKLDNLLSTQQHQCTIDIPAGNLENHQALIDDLCSGDDVVAIVDKFLSFDIDDKWMQRAKSGLAAGSPLAIRWIFKQLSMCENLPLNTVFQHEILLATTIVRHTEFAEGVRALLIDKDQKPDWQYKRLSHVTDQALAPFFKAPWPQNPLADL